VSRDDTKRKEDDEEIKVWKLKWRLEGIFVLNMMNASWA